MIWYYGEPIGKQVKKFFGKSGAVSFFLANFAVRIEGDG